jgi:hypothetical protein
MGWLGRGLGSFGSDVGRGYDINLDWKQRLQNMAMEQARQKLADLMGPLQVQELQTRLRQMQSPQAAGIEKGPTGALSGVTWNPTTGKYELQSLAPGGPPAPQKVTTPFEAWRLQNPNAPLEDWYKLSRAPEKPSVGIEGERIDEKGILHYFDKNDQKWKTAPVQTRFPLPSSESGKSLTPFELWRQGHPKGTYDDWLQASKQIDRTDAIKAVTTAMNAFKNFQSIQSDALKNASHFNWLGKGKYSMDEAQNRVDAAQKDLDEKRQDAIEKLTEAGMPIPAWLQGEGGGTVPPPPGPPPGRTGKVSVE